MSTCSKETTDSLLMDSSEGGQRADLPGLGSESDVVPRNQDQGLTRVSDSGDPVPSSSAELLFSPNLSESLRISPNLSE